MNTGNPAQADNRDLVLAPGTFAYVQAENNGSIKTMVGPTVVTLSGQDRCVRFDSKTKDFVRCNQEQAVQKHIAASEGDYVILENPAKGDTSHPNEGASNVSPSAGLDMGTRIVIPGPCNFALWPSQSAKCLPGHHLSSNQYLVARVYNEESARQNWQAGVQTVKKDADAKKDVDEDTDVVDEEIADVTELKADELRLGQLIIIRGDRVSFYIPPTGIEVLAEGKDANPYVRSAVTLERLEYCILVDEDGEKRYERGPQVVFPKPTERFIRGKKGTTKSRKFRAIELTKLSGLHIKVIHDYEEDGNTYKAGDEIFVTGEDQSIYYPRIEHSIIKYGEEERHYATAIPCGEGRYVMDRDSGEIKTVNGPAMLLLDPRKSVQVRRILSEKECDLWYPGNKAAQAYNRNLRGTTSESAGSGFVSEEAYTKSSATKCLSRSAASVYLADNIEIEEASDELGLEEFGRKTTYTPPRTITLNTKYDGVPAIGVWTGYAVMVVDKKGNRQVVQGPDTKLLEYDEGLEILEMSTGKPKTTDRMKRTVYLQVKNNKVSDIVAVETKDHVGAKIKLSLLVNFEGDDPELWFQASNYVKLLCDHVRSVLKGAIQKVKIEDFYANHVAIIRDAILGKSEQSKRPGMVFTENGMVVRDVEVLGFDIGDQEVSNMLIHSQREAVSTNIIIQQEERELAQELRRQELQRKITEAKNETARLELDLESALTSKSLEVQLGNIQARIQTFEQELLANTAQEEANTVEHTFNLQREKEIAEQQNEINLAKQKLQLAQLEAENNAMVARFGAAKDGLAEAAIAVSRDDVATKVAQALSVQNLIGGGNLVEVVQKMFKGTPLERLADRLGTSESYQEIDS